MNRDGIVNDIDVTSICHHVISRRDAGSGSNELRLVSAVSTRLALRESPPDEGMSENSQWPDGWLDSRRSGPGEFLPGGNDQAANGVDACRKEGYESGHLDDHATATRR